VVAEVYLLPACRCHQRDEWWMVTLLFWRSVMWFVVFFFAYIFGSVFSINGRWDAKSKTVMQGVKIKINKLWPSFFSVNQLYSSSSCCCLLFFIIIIIISVWLIIETSTVTVSIITISVCKKKKSGTHIYDVSLGFWGLWWWWWWGVRLVSLSTFNRLQNTVRGFMVNAVEEWISFLNSLWECAKKKNIWNSVTKY